MCSERISCVFQPTIANLFNPPCAMRFRIEVSTWLSLGSTTETKILSHGPHIDQTCVILCGHRCAKSSKVSSSE